MNKNSIRNQMKETLAHLAKPIYEDYSYKIASRLAEQAEWQQAKIVGITISKFPEVDTYQIIRRAWELGKKVAVPKCIPKEKKLVFRELTEFCQLESVFYGLFEPIPEITEEIAANQIDLLIVPGLAYTKEGYRLGFGGGYYDRFLGNFPGHTLSLAFNEQVVQHFPVEKHDIPVSKLITPTEIIEIRCSEHFK
ncbi:5-formyltetrahydrofolate cyclo-ligase [Bacillus sp. BRMEA1]|uniref:5-formyltetrahydrofolate cyclo-ligase n=1 Tax=Neobacillus endophyticus TaxID=2738405 RepID=UPI00156566D1|nr:5-formyltetrahydrofolate cyclo-ligase [Neobacillus endophyticus]NRD80756.1 5-formyltetrahydrofolate cyclo-ligase [Neobacillus endophyticus]